MAEPQFFRHRDNAYINLADVRSATFVTLPPDDETGTRAYVDVHNETIRISDEGTADALRRWIAERTVNAG